MPRLPITAFSFDRPRPRIFFVVGLVSVLVALGGIGVAAWTVTEPRLDPAEVPESVRAVADVAEAAREARYVLTAAASGDTRAREAGAPYVAACFTRLAGAAERSRDPTTLGLVATLPARPVDRLDTATAALDAIAAYTDRRVAEARIEASLGALSDATRVGRIASALAGVAVLGVLVVLGVATAATSNYERAIQAAIPEETAGRTDADRVAFLAGRLSRARRVADRGRMTADELADTLDSVAASRREYQALVESQAELLRSREVELREKDRALLQDEKTALWRFSHLQVEVKLAIERWIADREPFCLVALDLNRFKSINETYGHTAGDAAILDVAEMLRAASRDADVACRRGGDEFMVLLPGTAKADGLAVAARILDAVNTHRVVAPGRDRSTVDFRIGTTVGLFAVEDGDEELLREVRVDAEYSDNAAITHATRGADCAQEYAKYQGGHRVYEYSKEVERYLDQVELPPNWDSFVRQAGRCYQRMPDDVRHEFLATYEALVRLTLDAAGTHTEGHTEYTH